MSGRFGELFGVGRGRRKREEEESRKREVEESRKKESRDSRSSITNQVHNDLWKALRNKDREEHLRFVCEDDILQTWTSSRIEQLSRGLDWSDPKLLRRAQKYFVKVMSTLVWIHWDHWDEFGHLFLEHHGVDTCLDRTDKNLPLEDTSFLQTELLQSSFRDQQYLFLPVIIMEDEEDEEDDIQYSEKHRMPFLETATIGQGGSGLVTKETIPPGQFMHKRGVLNTTVMI